MRIFTAWWMAALMALPLMSGCGKMTEDPAQPGVGAHVQRGKEKRTLENDIGQLAKLIHTYQAENGKPPKSWEEFKPYIQRDARHIVKEIDDGQIVVLWGTPLNSNIILAYEDVPDLRGTHVVARGDGSVVTMPTAELRTALENQQQGR